MVLGNYLYNFVLNNWQSFIVNILAYGCATLILLYLLRIPRFKLHLKFIPEKETPAGRSSSALNISAVNKKWWIGYAKEEVNFGLFIPADLVKNKELFWVTTKGLKKTEINAVEKHIFKINGEGYFLYRGIVHNPVYPDSRTLILRISGDFEKNKKTRIYYFFNTPYGRFPRNLKFGKITKTAEDKKLPFSEISIQ